MLYNCGINISLRSYYYKPLNDTNSTKPNISFTNNSATIAGFDIYGASLFWCNRRNVDIHEITNNNEMSAISGDPARVCKCDDENQPQCNIFWYTQDAYPGETIAIALVLVGGDWGPTPGTVYAHYTSDSSNLILSSQYNQLINSTQCTALSYTLYTNQSVQLVLTAHSFLNPVFYDSCGKINSSNKVTCALISPLYINLNILSCPPGFSLQGDPPGCDCYPVLTDNGVKCYINNKKMIYFSWNTSFWMSITLNNTVYSKYCPFNYCNNAKSIQSVVDKQCAFNRAGRLCGECKEPFSLAIGSSHCIHCPTYNNLALLIFFAAAGFMLVVLINLVY